MVTWCNTSTLWAASASTVRDAQGQLSESTPPQGKPTQMERGPGGQVQSITRPGGAQTQLQHDRFDRLTQVTDPLGQTTRYRCPDPAKEPSGNWL